MAVPVGTHPLPGVDCPPRPRPAAFQRARVVGCAAAAAWAASILAACTLDPGERFGRPPADLEEVHIAIPEGPGTLDPARVQTHTDVVIARALFATLVERDADGEPAPGLATAWQMVEGTRTLRLTMRTDARFSDGTALSAHDVVWSWQRALRTTVGARDRSPLAVIAQGAELVAGLVLRAADGAALEQTPFSVFDPARAPARRAAETPALPPGARARVTDSNARRPCCGVHVALLAGTRTDEAALATLAPDAVGRVLAARVVDGATWLRMRDPDGRTGWAPSSALAIAVPPVSVRRVVERGAGSLQLRAGPDGDAPVREELHDDDAVEVLERGPAFSLVLSAQSGRAGFIDSAVLEEALGERWWLAVQDLSQPDLAGWLAADALTFDPGMLAARAIDEHTLELDLAEDATLDDALRALAEPLMSPVPARLVDEHGYAWATPEHIITSGAFLLRTIDGQRVRLARVDRTEDMPALVVLDIEREPLAAVHRFRAGEVDALVDGMLPAPLLPTLRRAEDFVAGPRGGALVSVDLDGVSLERLTLAHLRFRQPRTLRAGTSRAGASP